MESALVEGGPCATVNWSEIAQKVRALGTDRELARALLASHDLRLEPVTVEDTGSAACGDLLTDHPVGEVAESVEDEPRR